MQAELHWSSHKVSASCLTSTTIQVSWQILVKLSRMKSAIFWAATETGNKLDTCFCTSLLLSSLAYSLTLKMEIVCSSKTFGSAWTRMSWNLKSLLWEPQYQISWKSVFTRVVTCRKKLDRWKTNILKLTGAFLWLFAVITPVEEDAYKGF
jgi:hypothetical protein